MAKEKSSEAIVTVKVAKSKEEVEVERAERRAENERKTKIRVEKAGERGALVVNPEGGEAQIFYYMGRSVDSIFRTSRKQELKLSVINIKEMGATLAYKKALVAFSDEMKGIAKMLDKDYREEAMVADYRKDLPKEEAMFEKIKLSFSENDSEKSKK